MDGFCGERTNCAPLLLPTAVAIALPDATDVAAAFKVNADAAAAAAAEGDGTRHLLVQGAGSNSGEVSDGK